MVDNAKGAVDRISTIFYLCRFRYEADARAAGARLATEPESNELCRHVMSEIRAELATPSANLGPVAAVRDEEIRNYLKTLLEAYDQEMASDQKPS